MLVHRYNLVISYRIKSKPPLKIAICTYIVAAQCKVFIKMLPKLVIGIKASISTVCDECLSRSLISEELYESLLQLNASDADKARRVLLNVKQVVALHEEKFQEFVEVLREVGGCGHLAEELNKALNS